MCPVTHSTMLILILSPIAFCIKLYVHLHRVYFNYHCFYFKIYYANNLIRNVTDTPSPSKLKNSQYVSIAWTKHQRLLYSVRIICFLIPSAEYLPFLIYYSNKSSVTKIMFTKFLFLCTILVLVFPSPITTFYLSHLNRNYNHFTLYLFCTFLIYICYEGFRKYLFSIILMFGIASFFY